MELSILRRRERVVLRALRRNRRILTAIGLVFFSGLVITCVADLGIRRLCPASSHPLQWRLKPAAGENVSLPIGRRRFPAMELHGLFAQHLYVWAGEVPSTGSPFAGIERPAPPGWSSLDSLSSGRRGSEMAYEGSAFGLPFRSSTREAVTDAAPLVATGPDGGLQFIGIDPVYVVGDAAGYRVRAVRIRVLGSLANATLWSGILIGPYTMAIAWRRWLRRKKVHCERCGYDLCGLTRQAGGPAASPTCPECGGVSARAAAPSIALSERP